MTPRHGRHGQDGDKIRDPPRIGDKSPRGQDDHTSDAKQGEADGVFEFLDHLGDLDEEV